MRKSEVKFICVLFLLISSGQLAAAPAPAEIPLQNRFSFYVSPLFLQPQSNNLIYAVFVAGHQPLSQSWHNQMINPGYSPAVEFGAQYGFEGSNYNISFDWLYLNTSDSTSKQANDSTALSTVQFVAPPYDVGPAVFGIKKGSGKVDNNFNDVRINVGKMFAVHPSVSVRVFGGLNFLQLNQNVTAVFSDYAGSPLIPNQAYPLPPDPSFNFKTKNNSNYWGVGPDLGIDVKYQAKNGLGINGQFLGSLTAGAISTKDSFTSTSAALGSTTSHQAITAPTTTQVVPGFDSKVGVFYNHLWRNMLGFSMELGYRFAYFANAISVVSPDTLVQAGTDALIPEFATGTMAINSTTSSNSPFSIQGPYLTFSVDVV